MERYRAINNWAVTSAELIEQVQFDDHRQTGENRTAAGAVITLALAAVRLSPGGHLKTSLFQKENTEKGEK